MNEPKKFKGWDMEQAFSNAGVFRNGISDRPAHMDSYMTVIDFVRFDETWTKIKNDFTREEWKAACEYWLSQNYLSPMAGLLARLVQRKLDVN